MWIDKAHHFYMVDNELGPFILMDMWYAVKNEAKWVAYNDGLKVARKRKGSDKEVARKDSDVVDVEENVQCPRPIGQKQAKKTAKKNKKSKLCDSYIEELRTLGRIQYEDHANQVKVLEVQQKLSSDKLEAAKLAHLRAKEQKEAGKVQKEAKRYEAEVRMFETYNCFL
uniref:No apical meristem-associated C-terminal domain-containing protein n=1 Tax=Setaria viridis TaxID=4556 RepID=A0A4V6D0Q4_SETVI|nr:hypothetical protein SEVIR_9G108332v2 [Setaria viridis]